MSQIRYFLPGDKVGKCLWHIRGAIRELHAYKEKPLPIIRREFEKRWDGDIHCAQAVLEGIRNRTGAGDPYLERMCFVFDGGVGLKGGICGALAGAVLEINLLLGMNIRDTSYFQALRAFAVGHINLILKKPLGSLEPFGTGKQLVKRFREEAGAIDCRTITQTVFSNLGDFQEHIPTCQGVLKSPYSLICTLILIFLNG